MQGKEKENNFGLNRINFGARTFNPATVAWDRIDEYSEKYYSFSPYSYVANNPLKFIDTDGKKIFLVVSRDSKGSADLVLEYKNNKFYNQGKEYKSSAMTGFSSEVLATLNKIRGSDKYLDKVISTLESTSTNHFIEFSKDIAGSGVLGNTNDVSPKSSIMRIKLGDYNKPLDSGEQNTLGTTIAHELSHQYDRETGKQDINVLRKDEGTERDPNEIRAVNLENRYRVNNGIELRKNYGGRIDPNKLEDPKKPKQ
jgi:RHS repeat-associated protein